MTQERCKILAYLTTPRGANPRRLQLSAGLAALALLAAVAAFGTAPDSRELAPHQREIIEPLAVAPTPAEALREFYVRQEAIRRGDTVASLLTRMGVDTPSTLESLRALPEAREIFRQLAPGKTVTARVSGDGELVGMIFPLNGDKTRALFVDRVGADYTISERVLPLETHVLMKSAVIRYSLFAATDAAGIPDSVAMQLADIFGGDIDFHHGLRKGDRFSVVYESIEHLGRPIRTGRILATEFVNDGKVFQAAWFGDANGRGGYYTPEGKSVHKAFLRSPLEFTRITSGFSAARFHPILQKWRAHNGIDFGAPRGTQVRSTADGVVEFTGRQGGYGNVVILRHQDQITTLYGHLSAFARGLRSGMRVAQGDVIGYVGMTGLATGPHLHYEFRINGIYRNPLLAASPPAPPLALDQLSMFHLQSAPQLSMLNMIHGSELGALE
jgi:murein DD-endopeptidase MepM/ murein hydrolase activator NlpD